MALIATEVRLAGDRSTEQGKMLLAAIAKTNRRLKEHDRRRRQERELVHNEGS